MAGETRATAPRREGRPSFRDRLGVIAPFAPEMERQYLDQRFKDTRLIAIVMGFAGSALAIGLLGWDWVHDPAHVAEALPRRLLLGAILLAYPLAVIAGVGRRALPWLLGLVVLGTEGVFLWHLSLLREGLVYGIAGFMYWFLLPIFMGLPCRFSAGLIINVASATLPNLLVPLGIAPAFELDKYNVLIWPTCVIAMIIQLLIDQLFRQIFRHRCTIEEMARIDALAGIANRRYFFEFATWTLALAGRHHQPVAVLMLDIDHFKRINDARGHLEGDRVIRHVASLLQDILRKSDLPCRYGGEEFAMLLPQTEPVTATVVAERVRLAIARTPLPGNTGDALQVTVSVGVAGYFEAPLDADLEELLKRADDALYEAKNSGRDRVVVDPASTAGPSARHSDPSERRRSSSGLELEPVS
jgi:diguanylate cyclase (GGDEF)-like protein